MATRHTRDLIEKVYKGECVFFLYVPVTVSSCHSYLIFSSEGVKRTFIMIMAPTSLQQLASYITDTRYMLHSCTSTSSVYVYDTPTTKWTFCIKSLHAFSIWLFLWYSVVAKATHCVANWMVCISSDEVWWALACSWFVCFLCVDYWSPIDHHIVYMLTF